MLVQLSQSIDNLVEGAMGGLATSEAPRVVVTPQLQLKAAVDFAAFFSNASISPSGTASVTLPVIANADPELSLGVAVATMPPLRPGQKSNLTSDLLRFSVSDRTQGGADVALARRRRLLVGEVVGAVQTRLEQKSDKPTKVCGAWFLADGCRRLPDDCPCVVRSQPLT
jgi:hypothetical protein